MEKVTQVIEVKSNSDEKTFFSITANISPTVQSCKPSTQNYKTKSW